MENKRALEICILICIMVSLTACTEKNIDSEMTAYTTTTELTETTTEVIDTTSFIQVENVSIDELESAMQILSDEYVKMAEYVKKGMEIYDDYMKLGTEIKYALINIREAKSNNADNEDDRMKLTNNMDEIAIRLYEYAETVGYDISFEDNTNKGINPNGFYAGKSDEEILEYGVNVVSNGKLDKGMELNIGETFVELAKVSGSQGQWSGTVGDDDSLIIEYSTSDGENFYNMKFDVYTNGTCVWQSVKRDGEEVNKEEFIMHLKEVLEI